MSQAGVKIVSFVEPTFGENGYVVTAMGGDGRKVGWVVDPSFPPQVNRILDYLADNVITVEMIVLTHGHADHIAGVDAVHEAYPDARVAMSPADQPMLADPRENLSAPFGMTLSINTRADFDLEPKMDLTLGASTWRVLDTGGHSPGGISLYCAEAGAVIVGDALFAGGIGRHDFPHSEPERLFRCIRENLLTLPDETLVYSGHGPVTSIGNERKSNPFVSDIAQ